MSNLFGELLDSVTPPAQVSENGMYPERLFEINSFGIPISKLSTRKLEILADALMSDGMDDEYYAAICDELSRREYFEEED